MALAEFARLPLIDTDYMARNIRIDGLEHLDDAVRLGKGAILLTGHFGSWELMGSVLAHSGYPVKFVVGIQRNRLVQGLMNRLRGASGIGVIELTSVMETVRHIRGGGFIAMLSDQDAGRRGVFVEFLGAEASTPKGAARLALATGAPIIPGFIVRSARMEHTITIEEPIHVDGRGDKETLVQRVTQQYTKVIEDYVRRYPDHWLWAHRRWKTQPPGSGLAF
jgi:KDO2-lipid IV(A) lauroyltransferase